MLTLLPKGVKKKKKRNHKKICSICHRCERYRWQTLSCEYLHEFSKKLETALMILLGAWEKLFQEKN
jgi:hypothetical protein